MNITEAKQKVIQAGKELSDSKLIARTWGNVSCRTDDEHFVITASGKDYLTLTEDEVIEVAVNDLSYEGNIKPSSEKKVHAAVYELIENAGFIIHTHQNYASAVSAMGVAAIKTDEKYDRLNGVVLCAEYGLPGTDRLCRNVATTVGASVGNAVIMRNHGALCYGENYEEAFKTAHQLEEACRDYLTKSNKIFENDIDIIGSKDDKEGAFLEGIRFGFNSSYIILNKSDIVVKFSQEYRDLMPYLDDFAQMIGEKAPIVVSKEDRMRSEIHHNNVIIVNGKGAMCRSRDFDDAVALSMLVTKDVMAYMASAASGTPKPIDVFDVFLMRKVYKTKYSKLKKNKE